MSDSESLFKDAATDSIQLVVELFNRPHDTISWDLFNGWGE